MTKRRIKLLSIILSLSLCFSAAGGALAMTPSVSGSGTEADPKVTVTISARPGEGGTAVSTQTTRTEWTEVSPESGLGKAYESTESSSVVTGPAGQTLCEYGYEEGRQSNVVEAYPELELPLSPGESASASSQLSDSVSGSTAQDNPQQYDQTAVTVQQQRVVTATMSEARLSTGEDDGEAGEGGLSAVQPVWEGDEQDITAPRPDRFADAGQPGPDGYNFQYTGWGQDSHYGAYHTSTPSNSNSSTTDEADILQFLLTDMANPELPDHTAYCADLDTGAQEGWWYRLDNLETAGYYDSEAANHIRAIAAHGYWGTADGEAGSLSRFRDTLIQAQQADSTGALAGLDFSRMTEGEAQAATQMAIWQYGNRANGGELSLSASSYNGSSGWTADEGDEEAWARINAAAAYLAGLSQDASASTQVITPDKFVDEISLTIKDKAESGEDGNASYTAELRFALVVTPGEKDSLNVQIMQNGKVIATQAIKPGQREYTIENLSVAEHEDMTLSLKMEGAQYLEEGVYIYTSEVRGGTSSQTFVGLAEGYRQVDLAMDLTVTLDVQDAVISTEHTWRREWGGCRPIPRPPHEHHWGHTGYPELCLPKTGSGSALGPAIAALSAAALAGAAAWLHRRRQA